MIDLDQQILEEDTAFANDKILIGVYGSGEAIRNFSQKPL